MSGSSFKISRSLSSSITGCPSPFTADSTASRNSWLKITIDIIQATYYTEDFWLKWDDVFQNDCYHCQFPHCSIIMSLSMHMKFLTYIIEHLQSFDMYVEIMENLLKKSSLILCFHCHSIHRNINTIQEFSGILILYCHGLLDKSSWILDDSMLLPPN